MALKAFGWKKGEAPAINPTNLEKDRTEIAEYAEAEAASARAAAEGVALKKALNLSDIANAASARGNLGLGSSATKAETNFLLASEKGVASGVASLDGTGKVPSAQLPGGAGGFTQAEIEEFSLSVTNVVKHGITPQKTSGATNQSAAIQTLMGEVSAAGGGILYFPLGTGSTEFIYRMQGVKPPTGVIICQEPGVEFRPPTTGREAHLSVLEYTSGFEESTWTENVGAIGKLRINVSEIKKAVALAKALTFFNVRNARFDWIDIVPCEAETGSIIFSPNNAAKGVEGTANLHPSNIFIGLITFNIGVPTPPENVGGGGAVQMGGCKDVHIGSIVGYGGISLRLETDALEEKLNEEIDGFQVDYVSCSEGYSAINIVDHAHVISKVGIGTVVARACAAGGYIAPETLPKGTIGSIKIDAMYVTGGLNAKGKEENTGKTGEGFSEKQEGFYATSGSMPNYTSLLNIGLLDVRKVSGSGLWGIPGLKVGSLMVQEASEYGIRDANASVTETGARASIDQVKIVNCCTSLAAFSRNAMLTGYMERWDLGTVEIIDNRGGSSKTEVGIKTWKSTKLVYRALRTVGTTVSPTKAEETSSITEIGSGGGGISEPEVKTLIEGYSEPVRKEESLGEVEGIVKLDLTKALTFKATVKGNTTFKIENAPSRPVKIELYVTENSIGGWEWVVENLNWIGTQPTFALNANTKVKVEIISLNKAAELYGEGSETQLFPVVNPERFGAKRDGRFIEDAEITTGTKLLKAKTSKPFTKGTSETVGGDVGKYLVVTNAGTEALITNTSNTEGQKRTEKIQFNSLCTRIVKVKNSEEVEVETAASNTTAKSFCIYGTDDTKAIQEAINVAVTLAQEGTKPSMYATIRPGAGIYMIAGELQEGENTRGRSQLTLPVITAFAPFKEKFAYNVFATTKAIWASNVSFEGKNYECIKSYTQAEGEASSITPANTTFWKIYKPEPTAKQKITLCFEGVAESSALPLWYQPNPQQAGAVFFSCGPRAAGEEKLASAVCQPEYNGNGRPAIIGGPSLERGYTGLAYSNMDVVMNGITISWPSNGTLTGLELNGVANAIINNMSSYALGIPNLAGATTGLALEYEAGPNEYVQPWAGIEKEHRAKKRPAVALAMPSHGNNSNSFVGVHNCQGHTCGIEATEHCNHLRCNINYCIAAILTGTKESFEFGTVFGYVEAGACYWAIYANFSVEVKIAIQMLDVSAEPGRWIQHPTAGHLADEKNIVFGNIMYCAEGKFTTGAGNAFLIEGGGNCKLEGMSRSTGSMTAKETAFGKGYVPPTLEVKKAIKYGFLKNAIVYVKAGELEISEIKVDGQPVPGSKIAAKTQGTTPIIVPSNKTIEVVASAEGTEKATWEWWLM